VVLTFENGECFSTTSDEWNYITSYYSRGRETEVDKTVHCWKAEKSGTKTNRYWHFKTAYVCHDIGKTVRRETVCSAIKPGEAVNSARQSAARLRLTQRPPRASGRRRRDEN